MGALPRTLPGSLRSAGLVCFGLLAAACGSGQPENVQEPSDHPAATVPEILEPPPAWEPSPSEVLPQAKALAARIALALTNYPYGSTPEGVARAVAEGGEIPLAVLEELLHPDAASAGLVVYPQLVGADDTAAAITVLVEQRLRRTGGTEESHLRVLDLRLERESGEWRFAALRSGGGREHSRPAELSEAARTVLDHPNIHLPDTGRWDVHAGRVTEELLELLVLVADRHEIHVLSLVSGRPRQVFGTDRPSRHAVGRAVDIHAVDGIPVVEQRAEGSPAHQLVTWLFELDGPRIGSPWALDAFGGRSFTDLVHQDHIHLSVEP